MLVPPMLSHPALRIAAISLQLHAGAVNEPDGLSDTHAPQLPPRAKTF